MTTNPCSGDRKGSDLSGGEVRGLKASGRLRKGAIATAIATEHGERNEHLRRIGNSHAKRVVTNRPGSRHEFFERSIEPKHVGNPIGGFVRPLPRCLRAK